MVYHKVSKFEILKKLKFQLPQANLALDVFGYFFYSLGYIYSTFVQCSFYTTLALHIWLSTFLIKVDSENRFERMKCLTWYLFLLELFIEQFNNHNPSCANPFGMEESKQ